MIVEIPEDVVTPVTSRPLWKALRVTSILSLVILFLRSLVTTSPSGDLLANETADCGESF